MADSPQNFLVVLSIAAAGNFIQPDPVPAGLLFTGNGSNVLPPQTVDVYSSSTSAVSYAASSDSPWLSVAVGSATTSSASPGFSQVSVNQSGLLPGVYRGNVSYQLTGSGASSAVRAVSVTLIVEGTSAVPASPNFNRGDRREYSPRMRADATCADPDRPWKFLCSTCVMAHAAQRAGD